MNSALIVGLGIGNVYKNELISRGWNVETLDIDSTKLPTYNEISLVKPYYNVVIICTPNYTHYDIAKYFDGKADVIIIEKPGVKSLEEWEDLIKGKSKVFMAKNNLYRFNHLKHYNNIKEIKIVWGNKNRVPFPGSWFTDKDKAFYGVSGDLGSHLLCMYYNITGNFLKPELTIKKQNYNLENIVDTDYGTVNKNGIYNVDDNFILESPGVFINAYWKGNIDEKFIRLTFNNNESIQYNFDLCPAELYGNMVEIYYHSKNNQSFINLHNTIDLWILETIKGELK